MDCRSRYCLWSTGTHRQDQDYTDSEKALHVRLHVHVTEGDQLVTVTTLGGRQPTKEEIAVRAGAIWLDERFPEWLDVVDITKLDLRDCRNCVLGQVYPDGCFCNAISKYDIGLGIHLGFFGGDTSEANKLTVAWIVEIERRRQQSER